MLGYCRHRGLGLIAYSPLMDGHLARPVGTETTRTRFIAGTFFEKQRRESDKQIIARVEELADGQGVVIYDGDTPAEVARVALHVNRVFVEVYVFEVSDHIGL